MKERKKKKELEEERKEKEKKEKKKNEKGKIARAILAFFQRKTKNSFLFFFLLQVRSTFPFASSSSRVDRLNSSMGVLICESELLKGVRFLFCEENSLGIS